MLPQSSSPTRVPLVRERPMRPTARKPRRAGWSPEQTLASMGFEGGMGSRGSGENQRGTGNTGGRLITGILPNPARRFLTAGGMPAWRRIHRAVGDAATDCKANCELPFGRNEVSGQRVGHLRSATSWSFAIRKRSCASCLTNDFFCIPSFHLQRVPKLPRGGVASRSRPSGLRGGPVPAEEVAFRDRGGRGVDEGGRLE